jgi:hypothetical protein
MSHWQQNPNGQYLIKTDGWLSKGESEKGPVDSLQSNALEDLNNTIKQIFKQTYDTGSQNGTGGRDQQQT